jgi:hypothetical protein
MTLDLAVDISERKEIIHDFAKQKIIIRNKNKKRLKEARHSLQFVVSESRNGELLIPSPYPNEC